MMATRIVIIGGGIGGLAAAGCLQARGIEATVYERTAELREVGAALGLWPNATRVLKKLGVLEALVEKSHVPPAGVLRDWRGRELMQMAELESDVPTVFAHRAELHRALLRALPAARLHLNKTCTGVQQNGQQMRAVFADGTFSEWADGVVGADGIRSVLREFTLRDGTPTYRGYVAWRGVAEFEPGQEIVGESWGRGQRFGFIPLGCGRTGWWATANKPGPEGQKTCGLSQAQWKRELRVRFAAWHEPIGKLLAATPEAAFLCNAIMDRTPPKVPRAWGDGPMTLLGDAAHPTTPNLGHGACLAIEDAAVLAHAVAAHATDMTRAFRAYERARFARTADIVRQSRKMGALGQWENGLACAWRNFMVRHMPLGDMRKRIRRLWDYDAWEAAVT